MKEKTVYLILAGLFLILSFLTDSEFAIFEDSFSCYIGKMAKIPLIYFFAAGISKSIRNESPILNVIIVFLVSLFMDYNKYFFGEKIAWGMILLFVISSIFTYLFRIIVIYAYKEKK